VKEGLFMHISCIEHFVIRAKLADLIRLGFDSGSRLECLCSAANAFALVVVMGVSVD